MKQFLDELNKYKAKGLFLFFNLYVVLKRLKIDLNILEDLVFSGFYIYFLNFVCMGYVELDFKVLM